MTAPAAGRYNPDDPSLRYGVSLRHAALTAATAGVRVRRSRVSVEQVLLAAAVILFPLGLVLILLAWYGAAHTGRLYAQIDYLISGGLLGVGVSVAGGFMYFGYWLSRQLSESRRQNRLTLQSLQRIEDLLEAAASRGVTAPGPASPVSAAVPAGRPPARSRPSARARVAAPPPAADAATVQVPAVSLPLLLATPRGSLLHRPDCPVVARRTDLRSIPAGSEGFGFCTMCEAGAVLG